MFNCEFEVSCHVDARLIQTEFGDSGSDALLQVFRKCDFDSQMITDVVTHKLYLGPLK